MALTDFTPSQGFANFKSLTFPTTVVGLPVVTTATTPITLTAAQVLGGLLAIDCQDAGTATLPTAALLRAAVPGAAPGVSFELDIINYGDSTLTIGLGTGITKTSIGAQSVSAVLTIVTLASKRLRFVCTTVANGSDPTSSDAWVVFGFGSTAAAVA